MKKLIILIFLVSCSLNIQASEYEFIPSEHVLEFAPEKYVNELIYLNQTTTSENLVLCRMKDYESGCQASSIVKYAMDPFSYKVTAVELVDGQLLKRKVKGAEKIYLSRFQQYMLDGKAEAEKKAIGSKKKLKTSDMFQTLSDKHCGSGWSEGITPELFPISCQAHDECYSSGTPKVVCDDAFLRNMQDEVYGEQNYSSRLLDALVYYTAVQKFDDAFDAFCSATPNPADHAECDPDLHDYLSDNLTASGDTQGGSYTGMSVGATVPMYNFGGNGGVLVPSAWSCELWRFPDGNGGHYSMTRNCQYSCTSSDLI